MHHTQNMSKGLRQVGNFLVSLALLTSVAEAQAFTNVVRCIPYHIHYESIDGSTQDFAELRITKSDGYDVRIADYTYLDQLVKAGEVCGEFYCVDITSLEDRHRGWFNCVVRDKHWNQGCKCGSTVDVTNRGPFSSREIWGWCECTIAPW